MERRHTSSLGEETRRLSGIRRLVQVSDIQDEICKLFFGLEKIEWNEEKDPCRSSGK
jgi:hypothetical protein